MFHGLNTFKFLEITEIAFPKKNGMDDCLTMVE